MMPTDELSDDIVAEALKKDARESSIRYSALGLQGYLPQRPRHNAPKPNTRFLRNIIRETDSHNRSLLAREAEESRASLRSLRRRDEDQKARNRSDRSRWAPGRDDGERCVKRQRLTESQEHESSRSHRRRDSMRRDETTDKHSRRRRHRSPTSQEPESRRRRNRSSERKRYDDERRDGNSRRSRSRSRSRSPRRNREHRHRHHHHRSRRRSEERDRRPAQPADSSSLKTATVATIDTTDARHDADDTDSDPLDDIIGPAIPASKPKVKVHARGRGTFTDAESNARLSATYDPTTDARPNSESEDDWDQALEALKDRQLWKQKGAERLRAAGYTQEEVEKWEKGGEKTEHDVRWTRKGEAREWDRGKVMGDADVVHVHPDWGRLK